VNPIPADVWKQIELRRPSGDELVARVALPAATPRLLAGIDARGRRYVLIALLEDDEPYKDVNSRGLSVVTQDLVLQGSAQGRYITVTCEESTGHPMLDLIGGEIAGRLEEGADAPADIVSRVLGKWRRFWGQLPRQMLTREEQIGLFSELWFLTYWLIPAVGVIDAVRRWRGPYGARHDFEHPALSIEAKGGCSTRGRVFKINGIRQLEPPEHGRLLFFSLRLREEAGASNTLPILVDACRRSVAPDADAEGLLDTGLIAAGYLPVHADEYSNVHWRVVEELLINVRDDFPRIVASSFPAGVPPGVEELEYAINLSTFDHLVAARRPVEAINVLEQLF
jgi:hypothetical protein